VLYGVPPTTPLTLGSRRYNVRSYIFEAASSFGGMGIGKINTVYAPAEFIFEGVREETLLSADAELTIQFKSSLGETVETAVPSHLKALKPPTEFEQNP